MQNIGTVTNPVSKGLISVQRKGETIKLIFKRLNEIDPDSATAEEYNLLLNLLLKLCREKEGSECLFNEQVLLHNVVCEHIDSA